MEIKYNKTGSERKALVTAISTITGQAPTYKGAPTFAYEVSGYLVDKNGTVSSENTDVLAQLANSLAEQGFAGEQPAAMDTPPVSEAAEMETAEVTPEISPATTTRTSDDKSAVDFMNAGLDETALSNLNKLIDSKSALFKAAFGTDSVEYIVDPNTGTITFPWFKADATQEEMNAYTRFAVSLCQMAKTLKRVTATAKEVDNEKYAFRCFLLRLGFIGAEYKAERKILLSNLSGNGSFKSGSRKLATEETASAADIDTLEEALADAQLIHEVNALIETDGEGEAHGE